MPTKVSVGLSRKAGLPNYGSVGASCHVELELDAKILEGDPERFRLQVRRAYAACRDAVDTELAYRMPIRATRAIPNDCGNETKRPYRKRERTASPGQLRVINRLAERRQIELQLLLQRLGVREAKQLSVVTASDLIAELQQNAAGDLESAGTTDAGTRLCGRPVVPGGHTGFLLAFRGSRNFQQIMI